MFTKEMKRINIFCGDLVLTKIDSSNDVIVEIAIESKSGRFVEETFHIDIFNTKKAKEMYMEIFSKFDATARGYQLD